MRPPAATWLALAVLSFAAAAKTGNLGLVGFGAGMVAVWGAWAGGVDVDEEERLDAAQARELEDRRDRNRIPSRDLRALRRAGDPERPSPWI